MYMYTPNLLYTSCTSMFDILHIYIYIYIYIHQIYYVMNKYV